MRTASMLVGGGNGVGGRRKGGRGGERDVSRLRRPDGSSSRGTAAINPHTKTPRQDSEGAGIAVVGRTPALDKRARRAWTGHSGRPWQTERHTEPNERYTQFMPGFVP